MKWRIGSPAVMLKGSKNTRVKAKILLIRKMDENAHRWERNRPVHLTLKFLEDLGG